MVVRCVEFYCKRPTDWLTGYFRMTRRCHSQRFQDAYKTSISFVQAYFLVVCNRENQDSFSLIYFSHFNNFKRVHTQTQHILPHAPNIHITPFHTKNNFLKVTMHIKTIMQTPNKHFYYHKRVLREWIFSRFLYPLIKPINTKQNM